VIVVLYIEYGRRRKGLSQHRLCSLTHINQPFLSQVERGRSLLNADELAAVSRILDIPAHLLLQPVPDLVERPAAAAEIEVGR
jgi:transcriptional regulator with XRE-family HTH domain